MITKSEFKKLLNKRPGKYSEEEKQIICEKHKQLPNNEKDWSKLARMLGHDGSGESLRAKTNCAMRKNGTLKKNTNLLSDRTIEDLSGNDLEDKKAELIEQQMKTRDEWTAYRRLIRDSARVEELQDAVISAAKEFSKLPAIKLNTNKNQSLTNKDAIILFSDWHIGQETDNFYNKYNLDIARKRVLKIVYDTIKYCKLHDVETLHILNLGDLIEGNIHTNARIEQETDVCSQLIAASELMAEAVNLLQEAAPNITYRSVVDNHSRLTPNKQEHIAKENLNRITDWFIKERLKDTKVVFKEDNLDLGLGRFTTSEGWRIAFEHGHEGNKNTSLQELVGATQDWTDIVCMAHWHSPAEKVYQNMRVFINNSLCGTGSYALSRRLFTKPSQKLIILDEHNIINIDISAE